MWDWDIGLETMMICKSVVKNFIFVAESLCFKVLHLVQTCSCEYSFGGCVVFEECVVFSLKI